jgi:hypothetical protein
VPDYLTMVRDGAFYGWPYSYYGPNVDKRVKPQRPDLVAKAIKPDYALGSHVAALGLAVTNDGAYIGQHGSWNRKPFSGYNVVFVPFSNGKPSGQPVEVLNGFLARRTKPTAVPSASPSTSAADFSSPTMSATRSGASRPAKRNRVFFFVRSPDAPIKSSRARARVGVWFSAVRSCTALLLHFITLDSCLTR